MIRESGAGGAGVPVCCVWYMDTQLYQLFCDLPSREVVLDLVFSFSFLLVKNFTCPEKCLGQQGTSSVASQYVRCYSSFDLSESLYVIVALQHLVVARAGCSSLWTLAHGDRWGNWKLFIFFFSFASNELVNLSTITHMNSTSTKGVTASARV